MRYLIIDLELPEYNGEQFVNIKKTDQIGCILSEEETLSKFKEVYYEGFNDGYSDADVKGDNKEYHWECFEETLKSS